MHDQSYPHSVNQPKPQGASAPGIPGAPGAGIDDLARMFNSAILSTRSLPAVGSSRSPSGELVQLMDSPAFRALLASIRQLARQEAISERQAAEKMILAFRRVDQLWTEYVFQEGMTSLRNQLGSF